MRAIMPNMFKTTLKILKNNMLFIQPLLMYLLLVMTGATYVASKNVYIVPKVCISVSVILMTVALTAGWLHINKLGIQDYNPDDDSTVITEKTVKNFKQFFTGVGENFLKMLGAYVFYGALYLLCLFLIMKLCLQVFGEPTVFLALPEIAKSQTNAEVISYLNSISEADKLNFVSWVWTIILSSSVLNFIGVLYLTVLTFEKRNIFVCFWLALKFLFKNILPCAVITLAMFAVYFMLNLLSFVLGTNSFSFALLIILLTLYLNYYILLVFCFYNERTKDNSNNGS